MYFIVETPAKKTKKNVLFFKNVIDYGSFSHSAVLDPEKKSLNGLFSLLNIRHPKKFKPFSYWPSKIGIIINLYKDSY